MDTIAPMFKTIDQVRRAVKRSILKGCARLMKVVDWAVGHVEPLSRYTKRIIFVGLDALTVALAVAAAFALTPGDHGLLRVWWVLLIVPLLSVVIFRFLKFYRTLVRYIGPKFALDLTIAGSLSTGVLIGTYFFIEKGLEHDLLSEGFQADLPGRTPIYFWLVLCMFVGGGRLLIRGYFRSRSVVHRDPVIIYGAGQAGARLVSALVHGVEYQPVALIDDDRELWGNTLRDIPICPPTELARLIRRKNVTNIFLALPSANRPRRLEIVDQLKTFPVKVFTIPGLEELVAGSARFDELRPILIEDLLGREPVEPDAHLLHACATGKSILVSGAGGSIGSELCRQLIHLQPTRLVLLDHSEFNLYGIEKSLAQLAASEGLDVEVIGKLGDVKDGDLMRQLIREHGTQTIYHAAAYKHVPIVEHNIVEGARNNVFGTLQLAEAAVAEGVERFVLISTDKAVRPTNMMGATKRFAEMILQGISERGCSTKFCMVRFGNVLDSSGSVVPLFREQIQAGGPVTVTHPEVTRYFMTIPEAAQLVIQAGSMGEQGGVFVLDMGPSIQIADLAKTMIRLAGYEERTPENPGGEIEIEYIGLRAGEKLYEELILGENTNATTHPQISRAVEEDLPWKEVERILGKLRDASDAHDGAGIRALLVECVKGYEPTAGGDQPGSTTASPHIESIPTLSTGASRVQDRVS